MYAISGSVSPQPSRVASNTLVVHDVGSFEASFVPTLADFSRLDARFRLPAAVWDRLPQYRDFGFAVFKLRGASRSWSEQLRLRKATPTPRNVHPMALAFRTRTTDEVFFPTVHVHDGVVHPTARFDHELYCQLERSPSPSPFTWDASRNPPGSWSVQRSAGVLDERQTCFRLRILGEHPNQDHVARFGAA
jgi:hypothetical protein